MILAALLAVSSCAVIDGDTIKCEGQRIRLLGIDAPELPGHCRKGRVCAQGDPVASTASLKSLLRGRIEIQPVTKDHYGRMVAVVRAGGVNLSCQQLRAGMAIYVSKWDNGGLIAKECPTR